MFQFRETKKILISMKLLRLIIKEKSQCCWIFILRSDELNLPPVRHETALEMSKYGVLLKCWDVDERKSEREKSTKKNERMLAREQIAIQTEMRENRKSFVSHKKVLIKVKTGLDELRLRTSHYTRRHSWWTPNTRKLSQRSFSLFDFFFFFFNLMENFNFQNIVRLLNLSTNVTFIPKRQLNSIVLMKGCWDYE